jgi:hypothetical protein
LHTIKSRLALIFRIFLIAAVLLASIGSTAQPIFEPIGANAWSLGGSSAAESNVFSIHNNTASLTEVQRLEACIYNQLRFGIKNLNMISSGIAFPNKWAHVGVLANHYGYDKFNQQKISVGLAKKLNANFSLGVAINYVAINIAEQENTYAFSADLGSFYKVNKTLQIGFFLSNITQAKYNNNAYGRLPNMAKFGFKYSMNNKISILADLEKDFDLKLALRAGLSYQLHSLFALQIGYVNNPNYFTCGFAAKLKQFDIQFASSLHSQLGLTPHIGIIFHAN